MQKWLEDSVESFNSEYVVAPEANCATAINAQKARNNFETSCMSVVVGARI